VPGSSSEWLEGRPRHAADHGHLSESFFDAYQELHPLASCWRDRMPLLHLRVAEIHTILKSFD
jgi:hypothetical protein